jgi:hypothetical protein
MDIFQSSTASIAAFVVGVTAHLFIFRFGEWDLWTMRILSFFTLLYAAGTFALLKFPTQNAISTLAAVRLVGTLELSLVSGIFTSMLIYRGFFHRLQRFPGPFLARFSNFYATRLSAKKLHLYEETQRLHKRYGDIVRLGAAQLSFGIQSSELTRL